MAPSAWAGKALQAAKARFLVHTGTLDQLMTDWKVRIPGRHAIGPVSTELLVRGIRAGRVPLDAEICEVGADAWQPLSSVDEFFEAMGLDDAETRLHQAPVRPGAPPDENDDED